ncbi:MAG: hypothetical protein DRO67_06370 [Candidatus Asgardarchaeum californiense]|nr:MAG: hypothetical protein DRO67_06370 [Candidatus Asgardarchaeum californiense]
MKTKMQIGREIMTKELKDEDLRSAYKANIAMCIYDNRRKDGRLNIHDCNSAADKIIDLIWS